MFQLTRTRKETDILSLDMNAAGDVMIGIENARHLMEYKLSKKDMRALVAELQFYLAPSTLGDES